MISRMTTMLVRLRDALPELVSSKLRGRLFRYSMRDLPAVPRAGSTPIRLYIAPTNTAGQGYRWARAAEILEDVSSINLTVDRGKNAYPTNYSVPLPIFKSSKRWQRDHFESIASAFSHVIIEASQPIFGPLFAYDVAAEAQALERRGVRVAMMCHGSEIKLPSRHASQHDHSPYKIVPPAVVRILERQALKNRRALDGLGLPVFVSSPGLLIDVPYAIWVPVVVDVGLWTNDRVALERRLPVVLHAPSNAAIKRSDLIDSALNSLDGEGVVEYRHISGVPNSEMPRMFKAADIYIDAAGTGGYGVAACEAMAAGCLVVSYVTDQIVDHVKSATGLELPIVRASPDDIAGAVRRVLAQRELYRATARLGVDFVTKLHSGEYSASVLRTFLTVPDVIAS